MKLRRIRKLDRLGYAKRPRKVPADVNTHAVRVAMLATGEAPKKPAKPRKKNAAAVALGRLGGKKGGDARAAALSPRRRSEIAREVAAKGWGMRGA